MNDREIKILINNDSEMSFYRMEGGRWCLIDDSDDALRRYISEKASSGIWDDTFFSALRQAAFAQDEDSLMIWFEGTDSAYADFRDCLGECDANQNIRVERSRKQQEETWSAEEKPEDEPTEDERNSILAQDVDLSTVPEDPDDPSEPPEEIQEEAVREDTGTLKYPGEHAWSWRKKYPELPGEEKEILRIDQNIIVDSDRVLVNKKIILNAGVSLMAKIECIHCTIYLGKSASVDILSEAALWLKHCVIKGTPWVSSHKRNALVLVKGNLHIYDTLIQSLKFTRLIDQDAYAVENCGVCHIVDTKFQDCKGNFFYCRYDMKGFSGILLSTENFAGQFILSSSNKARLENSLFQFRAPEKTLVRIKWRQKDEYVIYDFICFNGTLSGCQFVQIGAASEWEDHSCLRLEDGCAENCSFEKCGEIVTSDFNLMECGFFKCKSIAICPDKAKVLICKCTFSNFTAFNSYVLNAWSDNLNSFLVGDLRPQSVSITQCVFERCIADVIAKFTYSDEVKNDKSCIISSNIFKECIAKDALIYGSFSNNIAKDTNSTVSNNKFYSCVCSQYIKSHASYGIRKKPCNPFFAYNNEKNEMLSAWTEAMKSAKTEDEAIKIQEKLDETETHR